MDELKIIRWVSSDRRDSSFFMCNSEDVDCDESDEFSYEKNNVYVFVSKQSLLISNKGKTRRTEPSENKTSNNQCKSYLEVVNSEYKGELSITFEFDHDHTKSGLKDHTNLLSKCHADSYLTKNKVELSQIKLPNATRNLWSTPKYSKN